MTKNILLGVCIAAIIVLGYFLFQKSEPELVAVKVPVQFDVKVPENKIIFKPIELPKPKKERPRPIEEFINADSITKDSLYRDAITQRDYTEVFDDSLAQVIVESKVQGKLLEQSVRATIKEKIITVDTTVSTKVLAPKKIKAYLGAEIGLPSSFDSFNPTLQGSFMLQNKKDRILKVGFDTEKRVWAGIFFKI